MDEKRAATTVSGTEEADGSTPPTRVRGSLIYNPTAGRKGHDSETDISAIKAVFAARGWDLTPRETKERGDATRLAREAAARGEDVAIAAGGDGTVNEVVQGLAGSDTALGVIPLGTVNIWAREVKLMGEPVDAAKALVEGHYRRVDLGCINGRYFLLMAGFGFDGAVTGIVNARLKRALGPLSYVVTAARLALGYAGPRVEFEIDGERVTHHIMMIVVGNTRLYGGVVAFAAGAVADDGLLDVVLLPGRRLWQGVPSLLTVLARRYTPGGGPLYYRARHVRMRIVEGALPVQVDGDYIEADPEIDVQIVPAALRVIVPPGLHSPLFSCPHEGAVALTGAAQAESDTL